MMWKYVRKYIPLGVLGALFMVGEVCMDLLQPSLMSEIVDEGVLGLSNGGAGVVITNDKNDASYNEKFFTNTGTIAADDKSTAILVTGTDNATINLKGDKSRVEGLISLQGTSNNLVMDSVGSKGAENLYVKGTFAGSISNHSNVVFTDKSAIALDDSLSVDETSSATLANVTLARGQNAPDRALVSVTATAASPKPAALPRAQAIPTASAA